MRGCFLSSSRELWVTHVFPAHAGVFPIPYPHGADWFGSSPRMRGCFSSRRRLAGERRVFPAHAGVFLLTAFRSFAGAGLPRACGGVSNIYIDGKLVTKSSPRMRGCFLGKTFEEAFHWVFPAHAGVFLH